MSGGDRFYTAVCPECNKKITAGEASHEFLYEVECCESKYHKTCLEEKAYNNPGGLAPKCVKCHLPIKSWTKPEEQEIKKTYYCGLCNDVVHAYDAVCPGGCEKDGHYFHVKCLGENVENDEAQHPVPVCPWEGCDRKMPDWAYPETGDSKENWNRYKQDKGWRQNRWPISHLVREAVHKAGPHWARDKKDDEPSDKDDDEYDEDEFNDRDDDSGHDDDDDDDNGSGDDYYEGVYYDHDIDKDDKDDSA